MGPAIVATYLLVAFALNLLLGATVSNAPALPSIGLLIQLLLLGGVWEELGWTGYALPKLQQALAPRRYPALFASLILAVFRGLWHVPLIAYGKVLWFDAFIFSIAFQLIIAWLYNRSGSVPVVMTFHYASNVLAGGVMLGVFAGSERTQFWALFVACACVDCAGAAVDHETHARLPEAGRGRGPLRSSGSPTIARRGVTCRSACSSHRDKR